MRHAGFSREIRKKCFITITIFPKLGFNAAQIQTGEDLELMEDMKQRDKEA